LPDRVLLLPAYIGWSPREGSGVLDPVRNLGIPYAFYRLSETLDIDLTDLESKLRRHAEAILLLIHYFGRVDPGAGEAIRLARLFGAEVIEDEAHAMLTDLVGGSSGRAGRFAFCSLHKLLPVSGGGLLIRNHGTGAAADAALNLPWSFDLPGIARVRIRNYATLQRGMARLTAWMSPLWPQFPEEQVPQTFPVRLHATCEPSGIRDRMYHYMNERGFGVVSLYHTLVDELDPSEFPEGRRVSSSILNLPVHQDACTETLLRMVDTLESGALHDWSLP
jgi:dTDP-4-amino-4,6-dideoxygalactose transaminase